MLKSLLTPLKTRFEEAVSLRNNEAPEPVPESPEDFERDARVETMRMVVQSINAVEDDTARMDLLGEASRLMQIDPATKDVFREMDGFLVLMSFLSTSAFSTSESPAQGFDLAMQVLSTAMIDHTINQAHFKHNVGYNPLESSTSDYLNRPEPGTQAMVLSSLAAFVFQLPSLAAFLPTIDTQPHDDPEATVTSIGDYITRLDTPSARISHPLAIPILLRLTWSLSNETYSFAMAKLFDRLAAVSYANRATMAGSGIVRLVWDRLYPLPTLKSTGSVGIPLQESHALQKLLRRVIDVGAPLSDLKHLFKGTSNGGTVGLKALIVLKGNPQARWPSFLSFRGEGSGLDVNNLNMRGKGISVLMWIYIEHRSHLPIRLFGCLSPESRGPPSTLFALVLKPNGCLAIQPGFRKTSDAVDLQDSITLPGSMIQRGRWTHLGLTWASGETGLKMHVDGHLTDTLSTITYPRFSQVHVYYGSSPLEKPNSISNPGSASSLPPANPPPPQFYISSTHITNITLSPGVIRLAHHLGPRYTHLKHAHNEHYALAGTGLGRHLTYEAATALNDSKSDWGKRSSVLASAGTTNLGTDLATGLEVGLGEAVVCALLPSGWVEQPPRGMDEELEPDAPRTGERRVLNSVAEKDQRGAGWASVRGDVVKCEVVGTDEALRRVGGAAVGLGFVQRAETTEMLHESICVLLNAVRTNWRVLEDMESLSGYEVLAQLLYEKAGLVSVDIFNSLFEFLGLDFKTPSKSVVTNPQSYRAFALDIDLWARTNPPVQSAYFEHFSILLSTSKLARFTIKSKLAKTPLLKKLLLAVQLGIFRDEMEAQLVRALRVVAHAIWTPDVIKAIVAYLAANLHTSQAGTDSMTPISTVSGLPQTDKSVTAQRAELVLEALLTILHSPTHLQRFSAALPASRILLLLLGEHPTPVVAAHLLTLLGLMMKTSPSFGRKFELAHGWTMVRCVVPGAWDPSVHVAAFDLLFGRVGGNGPATAAGEGQVVNPVVFSTVLTALQRGLQQRESDAIMDVLVTEIIELYESVPTFRLLFKTKSTMTIFVDLYRDFLKLRREDTEGEGEGAGARLEGNVRRLAGFLSENSVVDAGQRQELKDISSGSRSTNTNRRASARMSLNILGGGEPTYVKTMIRLASWRKTTATSERQRLRKMIQDRREARRQASNQQEWKRRIEGDSELFPGSKRDIKWQLDDTEGPFRVRKKLQMEQGRLGREADDDLPYFSREVREMEDDDSSVVHIEVPPWAESYEISATNQEELEGDDTDDKLRHIRHELVAGDVVEEVQNVSRVLGVDAWPGLIILGKTHLYLVDGLYQNQQDDIVAAIEAPKDAFLIPGVALELENSRLTQKWPYTQLSAQSKRTFLFRDVGLEFYFKDNRTVLIVCATPDARQQILNKIVFVQARSSLESISPGGGEPTYVKTMIRLASWRKTTATSERQRLRKMIQDRREARRQASNQQEWKRRIEGDSELFPGSKRDIKWQLDDTEGPFRVRKKLQMEQGRLGREADDDLPYFSREVREMEDDDSSVVHIEVPPWAESYEISATNQEELEGDDMDDKLRHIRHELVAGDVVEEVQNVSRVLGVDAWPGLIILGKTHLYLVDGLYQNQQDDIVAAIEAPKDAFLIPGVALELENSRLTQKWLEFYFKDNRTVLIVCATPDARQQILNKIAFVQARSSLESISPGGFRSPLINRMSARVTLALQSRDEVSTATRRWQAREISNFAYLSILNQASGRTCNDLTQYPVFPWVLSDYTSKTLDLNSPESFRVLSEPMGALSPSRREAASTRYSSLESIGEQAFNYGIQRAWESASEDTRGGLRELIPEMFTCHEFLDNRANLDLGIQGNGERVDNVKLPPWCNEDPYTDRSGHEYQWFNLILKFHLYSYLFIQLHRQALESELVSRGLPSWIDLIWGYKQRDPDSFNVFHPLSYEGTIDLDSITDPMERDATVGIIHNFGQTPRKIFNSPHPPRMMEGVKTLPLGTIYGIEESYNLLCHTYRPIHTIDGPVEQLAIDNIADRIIPCPIHTLRNPDAPHERLEWGFNDHSLRLYSDSRLQYIAESYDPTCADFVDGTTFLTGSTDGSVNSRILRSHLCRFRGWDNFLDRVHRWAHAENVLCVAASKAWSIVVSGSGDDSHHGQKGLAAIWDLKRGVHVWSLRHETPVSLCTVMESTGNVATCSATSLKLHTLNGYSIAELEVAQPILALGFHEREYSPMGILATAVGGEVILRTWKPKTSTSDDSAPVATRPFANRRGGAGYEDAKSDGGKVCGRVLVPRRRGGACIFVDFAGLRGTPGLR
ncbi:hypothetical protein RSAG8_07469, partial [Rhizoctonia solani AG-8 WAC10335]